MTQNILVKDFELVFNEDNALICLVSRAIIDDGTEAYFQNNNLIIKRQQGMDIELENITDVDKMRLEQAKIIILNRTTGDVNKQILIHIKK